MYGSYTKENGNKMVFGRLLGAGPAAPDWFSQEGSSSVVGSPAAADIVAGLPNFLQSHRGSLKMTGGVGFLVLAVPQNGKAIASR